MEMFSNRAYLAFAVFQSPSTTLKGSDFTSLKNKAAAAQRGSSEIAPNRGLTPSVVD